MDSAKLFHVMGYQFQVIRPLDSGNQEIIRTYKRSSLHHLGPNLSVMLGRAVTEGKAYKRSKKRVKILRFSATR
jgi:hypothetical protein